MRARSRFVSTVALLGLACLVAGGAAAPARQAEAPEPRHGSAATGYLGLSMRPLNEDLRRHFGAPSDTGVLVASVATGTPAADAGVQVGDVIVALDGHMLTSVAELEREIRSRSGRRVAIELYRDGERLVLDARVGTRARAGHHRHPHHRRGDDRAESWEEWGEGWAEWGEAFGEKWADFGAEMGETWGERGGEWGEIGAEVGMRMAEAFADMDWNEMDHAFEESMRALDAVDWEEIGDEIERALEEFEEVLGEALEEIEEDDASR